MNTQSSTCWRDAGYTLDNKLSKRHIPLDPAGYFIIRLDRAAGVIEALHFGVTLNQRGLAINPETGKPINAKAPAPNPLTKILVGRTAKELCIQIFDLEPLPLVTHLNHAAYLGRELQRAEEALFSEQEYIQD